MDIEKLDINAVCFGILCNFTPVCGEERAKEAVELVRTLQAENEKLRAELEQVKREILERLRRYRQKHGLGCFAALTKACGEGVTETTLRNLYHGDEVQPIQVWRQVGAGLDKLGVSKLDTQKEGDVDG